MIIGLVGRLEDPNGNTSSMGAGKSTVAHALCAELGFQEIGLADPLKRFCMDVLGMDEDQLWGPSEQRTRPNAFGVVPRDALRALGTEWGRAQDENVWIRYALKQVPPLLDGGLRYSRSRGLIPSDGPAPKGVVFSDIRFLNELEPLSRYASTKLVLVRRPVDFAIKPSTHQSEVDLNDVEYPWDAVIENDGSLWALRTRAIHTFEELAKK